MRRFWLKNPRQAVVYTAENRMTRCCLTHREGDEKRRVRVGADSVLP
ncbi:hypothetical protein [Musicola keenii]|nr:hypothetical protein [Musicola keenii]